MNHPAQFSFPSTSRFSVRPVLYRQKEKKKKQSRQAFRPNNQDCLTVSLRTFFFFSAHNSVTMSRDSRYVHPHWHLEAPSLTIGVAQPMMKNPSAELAVDFDDPTVFRPESSDLPAALGLGRAADRPRDGNSNNRSVRELPGSTLLEVPDGIPGFCSLQVMWGERFGLPSSLD